MKPLMLMLMILFAGLPAHAGLPVLASGKVDRIEDFSSRHIGNKTVDVWLPDGYSAETRYAVLYMYDGQMLFDAATTWNRQEWRLDETAGVLEASGKARPFIVVGIWNAGPARHSEYFPEKPFKALAEKTQKTLYELKRGDGPLFAKPIYSDAFLKFVVEELKPYIDSHYSVGTGPEDTFVMGSSMGGLMSMYALLEYPDVFGGAACLSTHWPGTFKAEDNPVPDAFLAYMAAHLPPPAMGRKLYFDRGDHTLDAMYPALQSRVDALMRKKGYKSPQWQTRVFKGADHSENSWAARLSIPLLFLLGKPGGDQP